MNSTSQEFTRPHMPIDTGKRRAGRRPGHPETQQVILAAAQRLFAERGYAKTTIRAVAEAAEVDPALVPYYFQSKEGLFRAALDVPIDPEKLIDTILAEGDVPAPLRLVQAYLAIWDAPESELAMIGFFRRIISEPETVDLMRDFIGTTALQRAVSTLLADTDPTQARLRIELVMSHLVGLMVLRKVLKVSPIADMTSDQVATLVAPTIAQYLHGDLPFSLAAPDSAPPRSISRG